MNDDIQFTNAAFGFDPITRTGSFVLVRSGEAPCMVSVTRRGILNAASPPRATNARFMECIENFREIAIAKQQSGERLLTVTAEDVRRWRTRRNAMLCLQTEDDDSALISPAAPVISLGDYRRGNCA